MFGKSVGCSGAINYPISAKAEEWLLSRLPDELEGIFLGELLKKFIKGFGCNGRRVDSQRGNSSLYELRRPVERKWGKGLFGTTKCTSSMILANLYSLGNVEPAHGAMMAYFLGALDGVPAGSNGLSTKWILDVDQLPDDPTTRQLASMLHAFHAAYLIQVPVYIDA